MNPPDAELRRLTDGWYDGTLSHDDARRLEHRLEADPDAREYFLGMAELEAALPAAAGRLPAAEKRPVRTFLWLRTAAVFLAGLGLGAWGWHLSAGRPRPKPEQAVQARITGMLGVTWPKEGADHPLEFRKDTGDAAIESGLVELTFSTGTRTVIEGPARFRVSGENAMLLDHGKLVAEVPKGAEGFRIDYPGGEIVDLGTEFGLEVPPDKGAAHLGVFRGEIEYRSTNQERPARLLANHAVEVQQGNVISVPFDQSRFTRWIPSREFSWELSGRAPAAAAWEFDISHLVWKPGKYRAICKWMNGRHGAYLEGAELWCDGRRVDEDGHKGRTGYGTTTVDNVYEFTVPADRYQRGRWTLRMKASCDAGSGDTADSRGVVLIEDGLAVEASPADFLGTWEYLHDGKAYQRTFLPDGTAKLVIDGKPYTTYDGSRWEVVEGCLVLSVRNGDHGWIQERHLLRDRNTLVFVNCPYRDAVRLKS